MTKQDIVNAYIHGDIDRRGFIRRLMMTGISAGAAMAYAGALVPGVSASTSRTSAGFITRLQEPDDEYGEAVVVEDLSAAIAATIAAIDGVNIQARNILDTFTDDDFAAAGLNAANRQLLGEMVDALQQHSEALQSILDNLGIPAGVCAVNDEAPAQATDLLALLKALAKEVHDVTGMYVALAPAIESPEDRLLLAEMTAVSGRYAAILALMVGENPVPAPFEAPIKPTCN